MKIYFNDIKYLNNTIYEILKKQVSPINVNLFREFINHKFIDMMKKGVFASIDKQNKKLGVRDMGVICSNMDEVEDNWEIGDGKQEIFIFEENNSFENIKTIWKII